MAGEATVLAAGGVTISTTGAQTGDVFRQVVNIVNDAGGNVYGPDGNSTVSAISAPPPIAPGWVYSLSNNYVGTLDLPTGYGAVILDAGTNVTVSGGDPSTAIVSAGTLAYTGDSTSVATLGDNSAIDDNGIQANIAVGGQNESVTLGGDNQTLNIDGGSQGTFTETGSGATIKVGPQAPVTPSITSAIPSVSGAVSNFDLTDSTALSLQDAFAASVVVLHGGADTVSATVGINTIFGGTGNDTVFAQAGVNYTEGSGNNLFTGGSYAAQDAAASITGAPAIHSTVTATTGHDSLFGGTVGDQYNLGNGSELFVGGGGADTMFGGSVAPTIFGGSNESLKLIGTNGGLIVASGDQDMIDASKADQGSTFFVSDVTSVGNTTLVGSTAAPTPDSHDQFVIGADSSASATGVAHTITIENFHSGDAFFLSGYTDADGSAFDNAVHNTPPGGDVSFTLSDNTTIKFVGSHPTTTYDGGKVGT